MKKVESKLREFPGKDSIYRGEEASMATVGFVNAEAGIAEATRP